MAEAEGFERTEQATPKRKEEARERGQVPRSREFNTTILLLGAAGMILAFGSHFIADISEMFRSALHVERAALFEPDAMWRSLRAILLEGMFAALPFLLVLLVLSVAAPVAISGWTFSTELLTLKWERLDPISGIGKMFSLRSLLELVKALAKFALILSVAIVLLWGEASAVLNLSNEPLNEAFAHAGNIAAWTFLLLSASLALVPLIDVPFQLWDFGRQLRMSRQEIKDELRQSEGSPEVRQHIRQLQREMARRRMMQQVPKADVIVTNPTHYSVALRYDQSKMRAPVVIAKGADLIALQIRTVAAEHRIPIVRVPPLARALYHTTKIDKEIPAGLYLAVAKLLAYVFQLRNFKRDSDRAQMKMPEIEIPEEFLKDI
jgi:flagellar biosynthesis protein FlhB